MYYGKVRLTARLSYCLLLQNLEMCTVAKLNISKAKNYGIDIPNTLVPPNFTYSTVLHAWLRTVSLFPSALLITLSAPTLPLSHLLLPSNWFFFAFLFCLCPRFLHSGPCLAQPCCPSPVSAVLLFLRLWLSEEGCCRHRAEPAPKPCGFWVSSAAGRGGCSKYCITLWVRIATCQLHREAMRHFDVKL